MKTFGFSILASIVGYVVGLFGGMVLVETFSSNPHDKSVEAAMTGAFVVGPLVVVLSVIATVIYRSRQRRAA
jgi:ABC-type antimicrobial peptide transport system permease subunit